MGRSKRPAPNHDVSRYGAAERRSKLPGVTTQAASRSPRGKEAKDRAIVQGPARGGCPVEPPVGGLHQPRTGAPPAVEAMQCGQGARRGDFEDRAVVAVRPAPVVP